MASAEKQHIVTSLRLLSGGLNTIPPSTHIGDDESPALNNWDIRTGRLRLRRGTTVQTTLSSNASTVTGLKALTFEDSTRTLVAATYSHLYAWAGSTVTVLATATLIGGSSTATDPWAIEMSLNTAFASNGASPILYWTGTGSAAILHSAVGYVGPVYLGARYLLGFAGRIVAGHVKTTTTTYSQRLRWCADSDYLDWDSTAGTGAGSADLADTPGEITGLARLGDLMVVLKEDAIVLARESGDVNAPITFPTYLRVGCLTGRSVQAIDPSTILFLGPDNVYMLSGGQTQGIADKIAPELFTDLNYAALRRTQSWVEPERSFYCLALPYASQDWPTVVWVYNWLEQKWFKRTYGTAISAVTDRSSFSSATTIDSLTTSIDSSAYSSRTIDSFIQLAGAPYVYAGMGTSLYRLNLGSTDPSSATITNKWESKDLRINPDGYSVLQGVHLVYTSPESIQLTLEVSTDRGISFPLSFSRTAAAGTYQRLTFLPRSYGIHHRIRFSVQPIGGSSIPEVELQSVDLIAYPRTSIR